MYKYVAVFKSSSFEYTTLVFSRKIRPNDLIDKSWIQDEEGTLVNLKDVRELRIDEEPEETTSANSFDDMQW